MCPDTKPDADRSKTGASPKLRPSSRSAARLARNGRRCLTVGMWYSKASAALRVNHVPSKSDKSRLKTAARRIAARFRERTKKGGVGTGFPIPARNRYAPCFRYRVFPTPPEPHTAAPMHASRACVGAPWTFRRALCPASRPAWLRQIKAVATRQDCGPTCAVPETGYRARHRDAARAQAKRRPADPRTAPGMRRPLDRGPAVAETIRCPPAGGIRAGCGTENPNIRLVP